MILWSDIIDLGLAGFAMAYGMLREERIVIVYGVIMLALIIGRYMKRRKRLKEKLS
jgi:hypothetical protein